MVLSSLRLKLWQIIVLFSLQSIVAEYAKHVHFWQHMPPMKIYFDHFFGVVLSLCGSWSKWSLTVLIFLRPMQWGLGYFATLVIYEIFRFLWSYNRINLKKYPVILLQRPHNCKSRKNCSKVLYCSIFKIMWLMQLWLWILHGLCCVVFAIQFWPKAE